MRYMIMLLVAFMMPFAAAAETAGTTPDSALYYGLDRAMESISLAFTFGDAAKAEKRLMYAEERLMEVQQMMEENKIEAAVKAEKAHDELITDAETNLAGIDPGKDKTKTTAMIQTVARVQEKVETHYQKVTEVKDAILENSQATKNQEQLANMEQVFNSIKEKAMEMEQKTEMTKDQVKEKLMEQGASQEEADSAEANADKQSGLAAGRLVRAENEIKNAEQALAKAKSNAQDPDVDAIISDAEQAIADAKKAIESGEPKKARDVAEELKDFGNEVSVMAKQLGDAKESGTSEQVKAQLMETIRERHQEHMQAVLEKAPVEAQQRIQERIQTWEQKQASNPSDETKPSPSGQPEEKGPESPNQTAEDKGQDETSGVQGGASKSEKEESSPFGTGGKQ